MSLRTPKRRRWANIVVAFAAAYALATAAWFPPEMITGGVNTDVAAEIGIYSTYALAGVIGFAAMFVATRWPRAGQGLVVLAGLVMLASFLTLSRLSAAALLSIGLTGLAFLLAAPFMGDMPTPTEEGRER